MGGSLVILIAASRMLWGMICPSGVGAGSALKNNLEKIQFVINVRGVIHRCNIIQYINLE